MKFLVTIMSKRGIFISLEGIEGCGKSTQAKLLTQYVSGLGHPVISTREPGGTPIAEKIRGILLDPGNTGMTRTAELLLYLASRAQHVEQLIAPALAEGKIVICERFSDATLAYQGYGRGLDTNLIEKFNRVVTLGLEPDLTFLLDMDVESGLSRAERRAKSWDRLERESIEFHNKVRYGYLAIARGSPHRVEVIDASGSIEDVWLKIRRCVDRKLSSWKTLSDE